MNCLKILIPYVRMYVYVCTCTYVRFLDEKGLGTFSILSLHSVRDPVEAVAIPLSGFVRMGVGARRDQRVSPAQVEGKRDLEPVKGPCLDLCHLNRVKPILRRVQVPSKLLANQLGLVGFTGSPVVADGMNKGSHVFVNV